MVDNPYYKDTTTCIDGKPKCEDCRLQRFENVSSAHFTICQKPWTCCYHGNPRNSALCTKLHDNWFVLRNELERDLGINPSYRSSETPYKNSMGMCKGWGDHGYHPIPISQIG